MNRVLAIIDKEGLGGFILRLKGRTHRWFASRLQEFRARRNGSYNQSIKELQLRSRLHGQLYSSIVEGNSIPKGVVEHYLNHRFDLLGSGWVQVRYGMNCRGLAGYSYQMGEEVSIDVNGKWLQGRINPSNLAYSQSVWCLVDTDYQPIDWQIDFKSGFRWSEAVWAKKLKYSHLPGVDVKVPWELARMQHLPQLALHAMGLSKNSIEGQRISREIRNQILDFISTNPPGFGVNWLCPMDVSIRAANWLLALDIIDSAEFSVDKEDINLITNSIYSHGTFIKANLEWFPQRYNHYLSHICGFTFIAAYLKETKETNDWLAFSIGQLINETLCQFQPDGGHFEGSIAYHRLSAEMVVYTTALVLGLPEDQLSTVAAIDVNKLKYLPLRAKLDSIKYWSLQTSGLDQQGKLIDSAFDSTYIDRLRALVVFFEGVIKSNGTFPQIGDNDSGRFFKLQPVYIEMQVSEAKQKYWNLKDYSDLHDSSIYYLEDSLHGNHLLNAAYSLGWIPSENSPALVWASNFDNDQLVVNALANNKTLPELHQTILSPSNIDSNIYLSDNDFISLWNEMERDKRYTFAKTFQLPIKYNESLQPITLYKFDDFGCYVFKHPTFYLSVRCLVRQEQETGSHHHADQLSVELDISGRPIIRDPGTYIYTALPSERSRYRTTTAHFAPSGNLTTMIGQSTGVFDALSYSTADVEYFGQQGFAARMNNANDNAGLFILLNENGISIMHVGSTSPFPTNQYIFEPPSYSPGYGIIEF